MTAAYAVSEWQEMFPSPDVLRLFNLMLGTCFVSHFSGSRDQNFHAMLRRTATTIGFQPYTSICETPHEKHECEALPLATSLTYESVNRMFLLVCQDLVQLATNTA